MRSASLAFAAGCLLVTPAAAGETPKSVVELFTSQGCSSCPPADRLASELAAKGDALVLTLPVDYWDYLGWKDTLANPANSARQRAYAMSRGDRQIFTPQIVVNGRESTIGGDEGAVGNAIARAEKEGGFALPVDVDIADGRIEVEVEKPRASGAAVHGEVWAFAIQRSREVDISRGENAGRKVAYANVVRHMTRLGSWDGGPARFEIPTEEVMGPDSDGVAVLVQAGNGGKPGAILGAARADVAPPAPTTTSRLSREPF
ncbi:MAG: DUF1223 domain-containing protein [Ancylobacter novellus]|uniref:DUF1223 domain-containing protein n=1 Tax=Ancylobacter novellus TaxID=921 RepID=A0A2W5KBJ3_ANCNO|nr:MAG: DUF1223 domain-containing protein [Ancylobacter novellus]